MTAPRFPTTTTIAALLVVVLLGIGAYLTGRALGSSPDGSNHPTSAAGAPSTPPPDAAEVPARADIGPPGVSEPRQAALSWLEALRAVSWADTRPEAWVDRARPFTTAALDATYRAPKKTGPGVEWDIFVARRCASWVVDDDAVVPPEAPRTATSAYVQVAGTVVTTCAGGEPPVPVREAAATTVETRRLPDGTWRVGRRIY